MNPTKSVQYVSQNAEHEVILEDENNCCLCGSSLNFKHEVDYVSLRIKEDAHCPSCQVQMKSKEFPLQ